MRSLSLVKMLNTAPLPPATGSPVMVRLKNVLLDLAPLCASNGGLAGPIPAAGVMVGAGAAQRCVRLPRASAAYADGLGAGDLPPPHRQRSASGPVAKVVNPVGQALRMGAAGARRSQFVLKVGSKEVHRPCQLAGTASAQETAPMADTEPMTVNMHTAEQHAVTVGGTVEVLFGSSDHADGVDGMDRSLFSRINVNYDKTLDSGLQIAGRISYILNGRNSATTVDINDDDNFDDDGNLKLPGTSVDGAPDVLFMTIGGGFGTVSVGAHAGATCSMMPRPVAFTQSLNWIYHLLFSGLAYSNLLLQEPQYCATPESVSYATPSMGGLSAMVTYAPNGGANQATSLKAASTNVEDIINAAVTWSSSMGGADISLGAGLNDSSGDDPFETQMFSGTMGFGGATIGASWFNHEHSNSTGYTLGAKYSIGALTPGVVFAVEEFDNMDADFAEESALVLGATYSVGGGLAAFGEYMRIEKDGRMEASDEDTLLIAGLRLDF